MSSGPERADIWAELLKRDDQGSQIFCSETILAVVHQVSMLRKVCKSYFRCILRFTSFAMILQGWDAITGLGTPDFVKLKALIG